MTTVNFLFQIIFLIPHSLSNMPVKNFKLTYPDFLQNINFSKNYPALHLLDAKFKPCLQNPFLNSNAIISTEHNIKKRKNSIKNIIV